MTQIKKSGLRRQNTQSEGVAARGKFVSGAKVLASVPRFSQPRRVYEVRLESGGAGKELSTNNEMQSFGKSGFLEWWIEIYLISAQLIT